MCRRQARNGGVNSIRKKIKAGGDRENAGNRPFLKDFKSCDGRGLRHIVWRGISAIDLSTRFQTSTIQCSAIVRRMHRTQVTKERRRDGEDRREVEVNAQGGRNGREETPI
jgi:hypothetical protein